MFGNKTHLSLVQNVVNCKKRNIYQLECFRTLNNYMTKEAKFEYNLKLKLSLNKRLTKNVFNSGLQSRNHFSFNISYSKKPPVFSATLENRRSLTKKRRSLVECCNEVQRTNKSSGNNLDFTSDYLYEKSMINLSVKLLKENLQSNSQWLIKLIKCEGEMDKTAVENILKNYSFVKKKIKWSEKDKEEVRTSREVAEFIKALQQHVSEILPICLANALSFIITFRLPTDQDVVVLIILRLIDTVDSLTFCEQTYVYELLRYFSETELVNELRFDLKQKVEKQVAEKLYNFSNLDLLRTLKFASSSTVNWHDNDLISLCNTALNANENIWKHRVGFASCFKIIHKLSTGDIDIYREKLFKKLYQYMLESNNYNKANNLCEFALTYAFNVRQRKEPYDAKFFDHIIDSLLRNKISLYQWQAILFSMEILGHVRFDVIGRTKSMLVEKPMLVYKSFQLFKNAVVLIIDSNDADEKRRPWPHLQLFLENFISSKDMSFWDKKDLQLCLRIAASLGSIRVFPDNLLEFLAQKTSEVKTDPRQHISYLYVALNQAVTVLHPSYPKPFLKEEVLSSMLSQLQYLNIPEGYKATVNESLKKVFESIVPDKNCFIMDPKTKLGHRISLVVAINGKEEYFNFSSIIKENEKIFIEDIPLPPGYKLMPVLSFSETHYLRNTFSLRSIGRIRIKTLEKMGYIPVGVSEEKWMNYTFDQQKHFMKRRLSRIRYYLSKSSLEKT